MQKPGNGPEKGRVRPLHSTAQTPPVDAHGQSEKPVREAGRRPPDAADGASQKGDGPRLDPGSAHKACGCGFTFNIRVDGDIHINNYCAPAGRADDKADAGQDGEGCRSAHETCIPVVAGAKHKQGRSQKMAERASRSAIPSVLAASTIHAIRRYVAGASPANNLEQTMFATIGKMPKSFLRCTVDGFDSIPPEQRAKLFAPFPAGADAWDLDQLATDFATEIKQRTALALLGNPLAAEGERPGQNRLYVPSGEDFTNQVRICRVNQLRTASYVPLIPAVERLPLEYQQECTITIVGGVGETHCEVRATDCPGNPIDEVCGRVVDAAQGDTVELEGVNFFDVDAKVRLTLKDLSGPARDIDGFVWGDVDTPLDETVGTQTLPIRDCRVHDRLMFQVPNDLPAGLYSMQVVIQNTTGNPAFGTELASNVEYLSVLPSPTAKYQIMIKQILAREETSPTWAGSDEVGLRTIACAMDLANNAMVTRLTKFPELDGVEFDSNTRRGLDRVIFESETPFLGAVIMVMGHEIDSERAYNRELDEWSEYFIHLLDVQKELLLALIGSGGIGGLKWLGWKGLLIGLAAAGIVVAFDLLLAIWGPADPIIDDLIDLSAIDLDRLVSPATPIPAASSYASQLHLRVNVNRTPPPPKLPFQYTELREYLSAPELSRYELTYQYNRLQ